mmetsp:Transcript_7835/g.20346  ORF Transcript_7835/g.20346 Transcript_7835/m.20346 type:complete len:706 (-) Transcript_7835:665-2782(-)
MGDLSFKRVQTVGGCILLYYISSIGLLLYNKWLFAKIDFHYVVLTICMQMLIIFCISILLRVAWHLPLTHVEGLSKRAFWVLIVPFAVLSAADIALTNLSVSFNLPLPTVEVVKSLTPFWTLVFSIIFRLRPFRCSLMLTIVLMCGGLAMSVSGEKKFLPLPVLLVVLASVGAGTRNVVSEIILQRGREFAGLPPQGEVEEREDIESRGGGGDARRGKQTAKRGGKSIIGGGAKRGKHISIRRGEEEGGEISLLLDTSSDEGEDERGIEVGDSQPKSSVKKEGQTDESDDTDESGSTSEDQSMHVKRKSGRGKRRRAKWGKRGMVVSGGSNVKGRGGQERQKGKGHKVGGLDLWEFLFVTSPVSFLSLLPVALFVDVPNLVSTFNAFNESAAGSATNVSIFGSSSASVGLPPLFGGGGQGALGVGEGGQGGEGSGGFGEGEGGWVYGEGVITNASTPAWLYPQNRWMVPLFIFAGGVLAFALNLTEFLLVKVTSALTMNAAGVFKVLLVGAVSAFVFQYEWTAISGVGMCLCTIAIGIYQILRFREAKREGQKRAQAVATAVAEDEVEGETVLSPAGRQVGGAHGGGEGSVRAGGKAKRDKHSQGGGGGRKSKGPYSQPIFDNTTTASSSDEGGEYGPSGSGGGQGGGERKGEVGQRTIELALARAKGVFKLADQVEKRSEKGYEAAANAYYSGGNDSSLDTLDD